MINPNNIRGPRLSLDYSRIHRTREPYVLSFLFYDDANALARVPEVLALEEKEPERLRRLPLTAQDQALGYTGGVVTHVDGRGVNDGETIVRALDADIAWTFPLRGAGVFSLSGGATRLISLRRRASGTRFWTEYAGYFDGPVKWRGNLSLDWQSQSNFAGIDAQYVGSYAPEYAFPGNQPLNPQVSRFQGGEHIPDQIYLDLRLGHRFQIGDRGGRNMKLKLVIANVLDASPPITANQFTPGYSYYGDPRRRRFSISLDTSF